MIECPYCLGEVDPAAVACRSCGRDLAGHMHLLRRIAELQAAVSRLEQQVSASAAQGSIGALKALEGTISSTAPSSGVAFPAIATSLLKFVILPDVLLLMAHHAVVFTWNLAPIWLLFVTLVLPIPFGFYALLSGARGFLFWAIIFLINSAALVLAMNVATELSMSDPYSAAPILPTTAREWAQNAEFAASIYLSFVAGLFASLLTLLIRHPNHAALAISRSGLGILNRRLRLVLSVDTLERVAKYLSSLGAIGSAIGAVYLGLQRL